MAVAWVQLGETYTHLLPAVGAPDSLAQDAFERAFALDSTATVLFHPIQIALRRGDLDGATRMLARFKSAQPDSALLQHVEIMADCVRNGPNNVPWQQLGRTRPFPLLDAGFSLAAGGARPDCATRAFEEILAVDTAANGAAEGRRWAALMGFVATRLARHNPRASAEAAAAIDTFNGRWKYGTSLYLFAGPIDSVMALRARMLARADSARYGPTYARLPYALHLFELGMWKLHERDVGTAESIAHVLLTRADTTRSPTMDRLLAQSLTARIALARGDTALALRILESLVPTRFPEVQVMWNEMAPGAGERILLARLMLARGDAARALAIANVIDTRAAIHLFFVPESLDLRLQAAIALGDRRTESELRRRIVGLRMQ